MLRLTRPMNVASRLVTTSLLKAPVLIALVLAIDTPAQAAGFSGICPVLGSTQPAYPLPFPSAGPRSPTAIPQPPVWVTTGQSSARADRPIPICAVYMSANQSGKVVPTKGLLDPKIDHYFPDLTIQPWFHQGDGVDNSVAVEWANSLSSNGYWEIPNSLTPDPEDTTRLTWSSAGKNMLVNDKIGDKKNQSDFSPYFLSDIYYKGREVALSSEVVYYNTKSKKWLESTQKSLDPGEKYWYWVLDSPTPNRVPGPLPLLGAGAAFGWSRRLRQRVRQAAAR